MPKKFEISSIISRETFLEPWPARTPQSGLSIPESELARVPKMPPGTPLYIMLRLTFSTLHRFSMFSVYSMCHSRGFLCFPLHVSPKISVTTLSEETAHSTVYHHLSQQFSCKTTAQQSLRWRYTVEWAIFSESVAIEQSQKKGQESLT